MIYAFDFDSTLTKVETLPFLAKELDILEEYENVVSETKNLPYEIAVKKRLALFLRYPAENISLALSKVSVFTALREFIVENSENCRIITSNLDIFLKNIGEKFNCKIYASKVLDGEIQIIDKASIIKKLRMKDKTAFAGDGENDAPALEIADFSFAASYAKKAAASAVNAAQFEFFSESELLKMLRSL